MITATSARQAEGRNILCSVMITMSAWQAEGSRFDSRSRRPIFVCSVSYYLMIYIEI